jgi:hypothetical protein
LLACLLACFLSSFVRSFTDLEFCHSVLEINTFTMRPIIHSLLALATVLPTQGFTNGSLIPSYFCNPKPDGLPKSLGELIPFTVKDQNTALAFNTNGGRYPHIVVFRADFLVTANLNVVPVTGSKPGNTGYMLASFREYCTAPSIRKLLRTTQTTP